MDTPPQPAPPTDLSGRGRGQPPRCVGCGYSLQGLPESGRCPECGCPYTLHDLPPYRGRPPFGWLLLAIVPVFLPAAALVPGSDCFVFFCASVLSLKLSTTIARRLAQWRYGIVLRAYVGEEPFPAYQVFILDRTIVFTLLQFAGCFVVWTILAL